MKIYALTFEYYVDDYTDDGYTDLVYCGFYATKKLAKKANKEKHRGECEITEIEVEEESEVK